MATYLLGPDWVLVRRGREGFVLEDRSRGIRCVAPRGLDREFPRVVEFLRVPRSRAQIGRFLRDRRVRASARDLGPLLTSAEEGQGSRNGDVYERRSRLLATADEFVFMNHGYASGRERDRPPSWVKPEDRASVYHLNLVREVLRGVPLDGRHVLDVGCGRGGTCSYLVRYHRPAEVCGLDYTATSIAFCRRRHRAPNLRFVRGDAHALPFPDASFHVVTNVESSHCYPAVWRFYREAWRVLERRGFLCYADLMRPSDVKRTTALLEEAGFRVRRRRDVTDQVRLALERNAHALHRTFRSIGRSLETRDVKAHLRELERGLRRFEDHYRKRTLVYHLWLLQKA